MAVVFQQEVTDDGLTEIRLTIDFWTRDVTRQTGVQFRYDMLMETRLTHLSCHVCSQR